MTKRRASLILSATLLLVVAVGCKKPKPVAPPPPQPMANTAPSGNKPTISLFVAEPTTVNSGQPSTLRWSVSDATDVQIEGIGSVSPNGRRAVYPTQTTTYKMTATSSGGSTPAEVTVTVSSPAPTPAITAPTNTRTPEQILNEQVQDLHFDYDKSEVRPEDQATLQADANALKTLFTTDPNFVVKIEGHCDERGSAEYNIGLGDRRASATKEALLALGVPGDKLQTVSLGKERPVCTDADESCYLRNRRAHFSAGQ